MLILKFVLKNKEK